MSKFYKLILGVFTSVLCFSFVFESWGQQPGGEHGGPEGGFNRGIFDLMRTVESLPRINEKEELRFSKDQAVTLLTVLNGLQVRARLSSDEAEDTTVKIEDTLTDPQLTFLDVLALVWRCWYFWR